MTGQPVDGAPTSGPRRRRAAARLRPEELARTRGGAVEGLDWLGRSPEPTSGILFRVVMVGLRATFFGIFRFRLSVAGRENLPAGACLLAAAPHRSWIDPFLISRSLPLEPKPWFLGSGPTVFRRRWMERLLHRTGGMLPVWRGGVGIDRHVASARAVLDAGSVFVLMPEGTIGGPPDRPTPFRTGLAVIALRTGAPIVPLVLAGSEELYRGKRMATRILAPTSARALLGDDWDGVPPEPGSRVEMALARLLTDRLEARWVPALAELHPTTVDPPGRRRRWRWLTHLV